MSYTSNGFVYYKIRIILWLSKTTFTCLHCFKCSWTQLQDIIEWQYFKNRYICFWLRQNCEIYIYMIQLHIGLPTNNKEIKTIKKQLLINIQKVNYEVFSIKPSEKKHSIRQWEEMQQPCGGKCRDIFCHLSLDGWQVDHWPFLGVSGMLSVRGVRLVSSVWRSYCLVCLNLESVAWSLSRTPSTPKHWLNLEQDTECERKAL